MVGIKRLTGFENTESQMEELTHDSDNDLLRQLALSGETSSKGLQDGVVLHSYQSGHVKSRPQGSASLAGNAVTPMDTRAGVVTGGIQTDIGDQLADILEGGQGLDFSHQAPGGQFANTGDGGEQMDLVT